MILEIPGYREAIKAERESRDLAFLPLNREICGVEVRPMTLRDLAIRIRIGCPFFCGGKVPLAGDVASFLWQLSPGWKPGSKADKKFLKRVSRIIYKDAIKEIDEYLDWTFLDAPASKSSCGAPRTSFASSLVDLIASHYHWTEDAILDLPLVRLYQYAREIVLSMNPRAIMFNRKSDKIRGDYLRKMAAETSGGDIAVKAE